MAAGNAAARIAPYQGLPGGGVFSVGFILGGEVEIKNSTISENSASGSGGGLAFIGSYGTIQNTTISGNTAASNGGGLALYGSYVALQNSTVTGNNSKYGYGGGIYIATGNQSPNRAPGPGSYSILYMDSTIVAKNTNSDTGSPDIGGDVNSGGTNNLIGVDLGMTGLVNGTNGNQVGTLAQAKDPLLGPLQLNGGSVKTHALLLGSPALDAGSNPASLTTDERGTGFARVAGPAADIGAVENQLPIVNLAGPLSLISPGNPQTFDATATTDPDGDTLTYTWT